MILTPFLRGVLRAGLMGGLLLGGIVPAPASRAQDADTFVRRFQEKMDPPDIEAMKRLVEKNREDVPGILDELVLRYTLHPEDPELEKLSNTLADVYFRVAEDAAWVRQLSNIRAMGEEGRKERLMLIEENADAADLYEEADVDRTEESWRKAAQKYEDILPRIDSLSDYFMAGRARYWLAQCYRNLEIQPKYRQILSRAEQDLELAGSKGFWIKEAHEARLRWEEEDRLIEEAKARGDDAATIEKLATPEGIPYTRETTWDEAALSFRAESSPRWETPSFGSGDALLLWGPGVLLDAKKQNKERIVLAGQTVEVVRKGAKFSLDLDLDGRTDVDLNVTSTPSTTEFAFPDGQRYAMRVAYPSNQENVQGVQLFLSPRDDYAQIYYQRSCAMEGDLLGEKFTLIDDNSSGIYGDTIEVVDWVDPNYPQVDAYILGRGTRALPLGKIIEKDGAFYYLEIDPRGEKVRARQVDLPSAKVSLAFEGGGTKPWSLILRGKDKLGGSFFDVAAGREVTVPAGKYELLVGRIEKGKGRTVQRILIRQGEYETITIREGQKNVITLGGPFRFRFRTEQQGHNLIIPGDSVEVFGARGERYSKFVGEVPLPQVLVRKAGERRPLGKPLPMKRGLLADWQKDQLAIWHPLTFVWPMKGQGPFEVRLQQKKHRLLGGPIESDWL